MQFISSSLMGFYAIHFNFFKGIYAIHFPFFKGIVYYSFHLLNLEEKLTDLEKKISFKKPIEKNLGYFMNQQILIYKIHKKSRIILLLLFNIIRKRLCLLFNML